MERPLAVSALIEKRAELVAQLDIAQRELKALAESVRAIDRTILLFCPEMVNEFVQIFLPGGRQRQRGEIKKIVVNTMRDANAPMTSEEIVRIVMKARGLNADDLKLRRVFLRRVLQTLCIMRNRGEARSLAKDGSFLRWVLA